MATAQATGDALDTKLVLTTLTALKKGDFTVRLPVEWTGTAGRIADALNDVIELNEKMTNELERVGRLVGKEGKIGERVSLGNVSGSWAACADSINTLTGDLVQPTSEMARVIGAVAKGDLSQTMELEIDGRPLAGEFRRTATTVNTMVEQLSSFASEVTRVAREVGTEGKLGGQAEVTGVSGTWKDLTDNVNLMASNLTSQVRNIADVTTAVATGDLSKKITVDVKGEILELKITINTMVDQLNSFASEVTRVAREVGTEGKLGGQADVRDVSGTWKDLTDNVNFMAGSLTNQVRDIADVTTAVAMGDLSKKITVDVKGEILDLKNTINTMVDQLSSFASEVTRVAREVGTDGKLGGQAQVRGVAGTWKDLTDSVNSMAGNLTGQMRNIAEVTTAVATGDLSKKITVDVRGEILELKDTINVMVDQLNSFASEVTRVAREVGAEGKLGGQADVQGVSGTWKDLTDSVNFMAGSLTSQVRDIAQVTTAVASGDLSKKITVDVRGEILDLKDTINVMVDQLSSFASEVTRVAREVGTEGRLGGQASVPGAAGTWRDLTDSVNSMASNLTSQVRNIATVTTAVANGDLSKKITVDVKGEILDLKDTINIMVDQLNSFASEVTRVAREVGTEGKLGGQADVRDVSGTWKDLTDNVNFMAGNLTNQVRNMARVVTAVANGDLKQKLAVEAKGEIAELADTINGMTDTLATFADQVTGVAREVGVEGRLGGQASVPGAAGTWKDLTDNVNQLAENLTTQVRAITEVATAVTTGDLSRSIRVDASGEVADLKDNINQMILNLRETTQKNSEQDWLKTNLAKFSRMLQGQKDLMAVSKLILSELAPVVTAHHGAFYMMDSTEQAPRLKMLAGYAFNERKSLSNSIALGDGLVGQSALEKERILLTNVPGDYIQISSGLGQAAPLNIVVLPVVFEGEVKAVIELASFERFSGTHQAFLDQLTESIGIVLNTIEANMRTEGLLTQSQSLAQELQAQQEELQQTNEELAEKARLLVDQNAEVERKNAEVEESRQELEAKAGQLALTSKYKSEFLANMSHELRTPLNSLLILSGQLSDNPQGNLTEKQVEFSRTIQSSGSDLLSLINDILDLSKIESGTVSAEEEEVSLEEIRTEMERGFRHVAEQKGLGYSVELDPSLPGDIRTDPKRLQQVLKNFLSNAFKFTHQGGVALRIAPATGVWSRDRSLDGTKSVIAFSVSDSGIGIPPEKQQLIFEAFQQADGTTSRKYGGTGLGLSISREIARLLGGEIRLESTSGEGSTFTLYLPHTVLGSGPHPGGGGYSARSGSAATQPTDAPSYSATPASRAGATDRARPSPSSPDAGFEESGLPRGAGRGVQSNAPTIAATNAPTLSPEASPNDRHDVQPGDRVLLIVEDDAGFGRILLDTAREHGFKGIIASRGDTALALVREYAPDAITLDLRLPEIDGWRILDRLKEEPATRHIPVHLISVEEDRERGLKQGALAFLTKPVSKAALDEALSDMKRLINTDVKQLLVVEDNEAQRKSIVELIGGDASGEEGDVAITAVATGEEALAALRAQRFDCMVLDLGLSDMTGFELIERMQKEPELRGVPIVVYTGKDLTKKEETQLRRVAGTIIVKDAQSPERLLDETALFLHRVSANLPEPKRQMIEHLHQPDAVLADKRVLIVDDDMRNIFATSTVLERYEMEVLSAENGREAIELLLRDEGQGVDAVLMDIMMPEMDGYETMTSIRAIPRFASLPIIAVTAKAMEGDREKCIEAGASDYLSKPVDVEQLMTLLRVWLYQ